MDYKGGSMFNEIRNDRYYSLMALLCKSELTSSDCSFAYSELKSLDLHELFTKSLEHDVASIIYPVICDLKVDLDDEWRINYELVKQRITFMIGKLNEIADKFFESNIPIVALKNSGIAVAYVRDFGKCPMGDIDTLVNRDDFRVAHSILLEMGFVFKFRSEFEFEDLEIAINDGGTEYFYQDPLNSNNQMWFEMSWRPIAGRWIRKDKEPRSEDLIKRSFECKGSKVRILAPEDNLLQVSVHTAKHSYVRDPGFRLHLDVERVVSNEIIDWDVFVRRTIEMNVKTSVFFSLLIPNYLFDCKINDRTFVQLEPNKFKRESIHFFLKKVKILHPKQPKFSRIEFIIFQFLLYDSFRDVLAVVFPSRIFLKKKYSFKYSIFYPIFQIRWLFDLLGLRKRKK